MQITYQLITILNVHVDQIVNLFDNYKQVKKYLDKQNSLLVGFESAIAANKMIRMAELKEIQPRSRETVSDCGFSKSLSNGFVSLIPKIIVTVS